MGLSTAYLHALPKCCQYWYMLSEDAFIEFNCATSKFSHPVKFNNLNECTLFDIQETFSQAVEVVCQDRYW